ncbi:EAL domain-containing protein [Bacillus salitolerans]|uniref:EAL domain-containing protein n=1 Tax=Bacillus salitolerans TaxID=1437434 RepID=A0ABW4LZZ8_9BACI
MHNQINQKKNVDLFWDHTNIQSFLNSPNTTVWYWDIESDAVLITKGVEELCGYKREDFIHNPTIWKNNIVHPEDREIIVQNEKIHLNGKHTIYEYRIVQPNGSIRWVRDHGIPITDKNGNTVRVYGVLADITELKSTQQELLEKQEQIEAIIDSVDIIVWSYDYETNKTIYSASSKKIYGIDPKAFDENPGLWRQVVHPDDLKYVVNKHQELLAGHIISLEYRIIRPNDGKIRWINDRGIPKFNTRGEVIGINGVKVDITKNKMADQKIRFMALHDTLTGLPNRNLLYDYLQNLLTNTEEMTNRKLAVAFIDLDRFKLVNDSLGHHYGDLLLNHAAFRLKQHISQEDMIARQGGDEFILILENKEKHEIDSILNQILHSFATPFHLEKEEVYISPSIGVSFYPKDGTDADTLIKNADSAMYYAKSVGKNNYKYFEASHPEHAISSIKLDKHLRNAFKNNEFELFYQPYVDSHTGQIKGIEALIRWMNPKYGNVSPATFIPIAEETGLIVQLGEWVLRRACKEIKQWHEEGYPKVVLAVNVSIRQFNDDRFTTIVQSILEESRLEPHFLELEITETIMQNTAESMQIISKLKELGVKIAIDDFGTGYSSLSVLKDVSLDKLKIDRSFVVQIGSEKASIISTIIQLGKNLDLQVVAEGVETNAQHEFLREANCDFIQGYKVSKPAPLHVLKNLYKKS